MAEVEQMGPRDGRGHQVGVWCNGPHEDSCLRQVKVISSLDKKRTAATKNNLYVAFLGNTAQIGIQLGTVTTDDVYLSCSKPTF